MEFPRAAPSGIPQTSLGLRGHLITNFPHIMVLLIISHRIFNSTMFNLNFDICLVPFHAILTEIIVFKLKQTFLEPPIIS